LVNEIPMDMNGLTTKVDLNIIPLGSYDFLFSMDGLNKNNVVLDHCNKEFTCLNKEGKLRTVQGITREVTIKEVSS
jgi:hypothetical protein